MPGEPIRISIQFDAAGQPVINQVVGSLDRLRQAAQSMNAAMAPGTGVAARNTAARELERQYARTAEVMSGRFANAVHSSNRVLQDSLHIMERLARVGFYTFLAQTAAATYALKQLATSFVDINEKFAGLEITLKSAFNSLTIAKDLTAEVQKITVRSPLPFTDIAEAVRSAAVIPYTRSEISRDAALGKTGLPDSFMNRWIKLIEQMTTFRPDKTVQDATFALREAITGQFRSLIRRFDIPSSALVTASGKSIKELSVDPALTFKTMERFFSSIIDKQAVQERLRQQPTLLKQQITEQALDIPMLEIGKKGVFRALTTQMIRIFDDATAFANEALPQYAQKISDALKQSLSRTMEMGSDIFNSLLGTIGLSQQDRPDLTAFERAYEAVLSAINLANEKLPSVFKTVKEFLATLYPAIKKLLEMIASVATVLAKSFSSHPWLTTLGVLFTREIPSLLSTVLFPSIARSVASAFMEGFRRGAAGATVGGIAGTRGSLIGSFMGSGRDIQAGNPQHIGNFVQQNAAGRYYLPAGALAAMNPANLAALGIAPGTRGSPFLNQALAAAALTSAGPGANSQMYFGAPSGRNMVELLERRPGGSVAIRAGVTLDPTEQYSLGARSNRAGSFVPAAAGNRALTAGAAVAQSAANVGLGAGLWAGLGSSAMSLATAALTFAGVAAAFTGAVMLFDKAVKYFSEGRSNKLKQYGEEVFKDFDPVESDRTIMEASRNNKLLEAALEKENKFRSDTGKPLAVRDRLETVVKEQEIVRGIQFRGGVRGADAVTTREVKREYASPQELMARIDRLSSTVKSYQSFMSGEATQANDKILNKTFSDPGILSSEADLKEFRIRALNYKKELETSIAEFSSNISEALLQVSEEFKPKLVNLMRPEQQKLADELKDQASELTDKKSIYNKFFERSIGRAYDATQGLQGPDSLEGTQSELEKFAEDMQKEANFTKVGEQVAEQLDKILASNSSIMDAILTALDPDKMDAQIREESAKAATSINSLIDKITELARDSRRSPEEVVGKEAFDALRLMQSKVTLAQPNYPAESLGIYREVLRGVADKSSAEKSNLANARILNFVKQLEDQVLPNAKKLSNSEQVDDGEFDKVAEMFADTFEKAGGGDSIDKWAEMFKTGLNRTVKLPAIGKIDTMQMQVDRIEGEIQQYEAVLGAWGDSIVKRIQSAIPDKVGNIEEAGALLERTSPKFIGPLPKDEDRLQKQGGLYENYDTFKAFGSLVNRRKNIAAYDTLKLQKTQDVIDRRDARADIVNFFQDSARGSVNAENLSSLAKANTYLKFPAITDDQAKMFLTPSTGSPQEMVNNTRVWEDALNRSVENLDNLAKTLSSVGRTEEAAQAKNDARVLKNTGVAKRSFVDDRNAGYITQFFQNAPQESGGAATMRRAEQVQAALDNFNMPALSDKELSTLGQASYKDYQIGALVDKYKMMPPILEKIAEKYRDTAREKAKMSGADNAEIEKMQQAAQAAEDLAESYRRAQEEINGNGMGKSFAEGFTGVTEKWRETSQNFTELGAQTAETFASNMTDAFHAVIMGTKSVGDAFKEMTMSILSDLAKMLIRKAITSAIGGAIGMVLPGAGATMAAKIPAGMEIDNASNGGFVRGYASGGRKSEEDGVPIMTMGGEYHLPKEAVDYYGAGRISAINDRAISKRELSGMIVGGSGVRDDIYMRARKGDYIVNKKAVKEYGAATMGALASKRLPRFEAGGMVGGLTPPPLTSRYAQGGVVDQPVKSPVLNVSSPASNSKYDIKINVNMQDSGTRTSVQSTAPTKDEGYEMARRIEAAVEQVIDRKQRVGGSLYRGGR